MVLVTGQEISFSKEMVAADNFSTFNYQRTYYAGAIPRVGVGGNQSDNGEVLLAAPGSLQNENYSTSENIIQTRFSGPTASDAWANLNGQPVIVFDSTSKERGDGLIIQTSRSVGDTSIQLTATARIDSVTDCPWNSVHHVYGGDQIVYLNNGSISQFLHVFIGGLGKNITWKDGSIYISSNPVVGESEVYVERWDVDNTDPPCITQSGELLVEPIKEFTAENPTVFSTSYYPSL